MAHVKAHTRRVKGKKQRVRAHNRRLQPRRGGRNLKRAYRYSRRGKNGRAALWAAAGTAELAGWVTMRGAGVALVTLGVVAIGLGALARKATTDPDKAKSRPQVQRPAQRPQPNRVAKAAAAGKADKQSGKGRGGTVSGPMSEAESHAYHRAYSGNTRRK